MSRRRELGLTVLVVVLAGLVLWLAGRAMSSQELSIGRPRRQTEPVEPLGVAVVLSGVALLAVRGRGRWLLGVVIVGLGVAAELSAGVLQLGNASRLIALATAPFVVAAGLWVVVRGRDWPGMGTRYDAPSAPRTPGEREMWEALDRGEDPTTDGGFTRG